MQHFFAEVPGVIDAVSGYEGGATENPSYRQVCSGTTNHAEVVEVTFDPAKMSYAELVDLFCKMHNPTQMNRQGTDVGTQYRSAIFVHSPEQERVAREELERAKASGLYSQPIVTTTEPGQTFWKAEDYHQDYFEKNQSHSCHVMYKELEHQ